VLRPEPDATIKNFKQGNVISREKKLWGRKKRGEKEIHPRKKRTGRSKKKKKEKKKKKKIKIKENYIEGRQTPKETK